MKRINIEYPAFNQLKRYSPLVVNIVSIIYESMVSYGNVPYFINDKNKEQFSRPASLTVDHSGNIFIVDEGITVYKSSTAM
ncbi:MAG: hypothetical protein ACR2IS_10135 [Nitrososphaeraceae archaeon]